MGAECTRDWTGSSTRSWSKNCEHQRPYPTPASRQRQGRSHYNSTLERRHRKVTSQSCAATAAAPVQEQRLYPPLPVQRRCRIVPGSRRAAGNLQGIRVPTFPVALLLRHIRDHIDSGPPIKVVLRQDLKQLARSRWSAVTKQLQQRCQVNLCSIASAFLRRATPGRQRHEDRRQDLNGSRGTWAFQDACRVPNRGPLARDLLRATKRLLRHRPRATLDNFSTVRPHVPKITEFTRGPSRCALHSGALNLPIC